MEDAYLIMQGKTNAKEIILKEIPRPTIARDSDYERDRTGYSAYKQVMLLTINEREWVVALGHAGGGYPADPYDCDITAIKMQEIRLADLLPTKAEKLVFKKLEDSGYFINAVAIALEGGMIGIDEGIKEENRAKRKFSPVDGKYIAKEVQWHENIVSLDLRPVPVSCQQYTEEAPEYLAETILSILTRRTTVD